MKTPKLHSDLKKTGEVILTITIVAAITVLIVSLVMNAITDKKCQRLCDGSLVSQKIGNGKFDLKDACICYYADSIRTFVLE